MRTETTADGRAAQVMRSQRGVLAGDQAHEAGLSLRQREQRVTSGRWLRPARNVFVDAGSPDTWQQRAAIAWWATRSGDGVLSYVTSGAALDVMAPSPLPHVSVPPGRSRRCGVARVHPTVVPAKDRQPWEGMSITTPSRFLVDMAGVVARSVLEGLTDQVMCRGLASVDSVLASAHRAGPRRGVVLLREVLEVWSRHIEPGSPAEVRLLRLLAELGVVDVVTQHVVTDHQRFTAYLDVAVPSARFGLEYDTAEFHGPRRWAHDEARYQRLRALGWDIASVTKADLVPGERRLAALADRIKTRAEAA